MNSISKYNVNISGTVIRPNDVPCKFPIQDDVRFKMPVLLDLTIEGHVSHTLTLSSERPGEGEPAHNLIQANRGDIVWVLTEGEYTKI